MGCDAVSSPRRDCHTPLLDSKIVTGRLEVAPFQIQVEAPLLADLRTRIGNTRWPDAIPGVGWAQGTDRDYLRALLAYWADGFDWRARERELNAFPQFQAEVDGVRIHFVHQRAPSGDGIPLILTHGWPSCFVELLPLVPLLTEPAVHGIIGAGLRRRDPIAAGVRLLGAPGAHGGDVPVRRRPVA